VRVYYELVNVRQGIWTVDRVEYGWIFEKRRRREMWLDNGLSWPTLRRDPKMETVIDRLRYTTEARYE
jgi:hypothetical protein